MKLWGTIIPLPPLGIQGLSKVSGNQIGFISWTPFRDITTFIWIVCLQNREPLLN